MPYGHVYQIVCKPTGFVYIGSSTNYRQRWSYHRSALSRCSHENRNLQQSWNEHGPDAFDFAVLQECNSQSDLLAEEQRLISQAITDGSCFNLAEIAGSTSGCWDKLPLDKKATWGDWNIGSKRSDATREKLSRSKMGNQHGKGKHYCGHLTESDVVEIIRMAVGGVFFHEIAAKFRVTASTVGRIARRRIWTNVPVTERQAIVLASLAGRRAIGERSAHSKLTADKVRDIRRLISEGKSLSSIGRQFGVSAPAIRAIKTRTNWSHV